VQNTELSPELADAADVLSDQLKVHLRRLSELLSPYSDRLERKFIARLRALKYERKQRIALASITLGAAARILSQNRQPLKFIEQVEYHGRRLAKMNLPPSAIVTALQEYDALLTPIIQELFPAEYPNLQWVRDQLHFCVILTLNNAYYQVREAETQAFYELFRAELESRNLEELLKRFIETMVHICTADAGHLYLLSAQTGAWEWKAGANCRKPKQIVPATGGLRRRLSTARYLGADENPGQEVFLDPGWRKRFRSCWSVPLVADGVTVGVMQLGFERMYEWLPREQELLAAAAERCMMAAEKARLMEDLAAREDQIRQLAEHMLHVEEMERRRISRELHDETGQSLLCIRLQMEMLEQSMPDSEQEWKGKLAETRDLTERTILEMRRLIAALSPAVLEQLGLGAALRQLVNRFRRMHPCRVRLHLTRIGTLPQNTEIIVYRLVQECCNNIAKHSGATQVNISVTSADGRVKLNVEDNGVGFQVNEAFEQRDSFGLSGMRERVALLGGKFQIQSFPESGKRERGTKIWIELPISKEGQRRSSHSSVGAVARPSVTEPVSEQRL
jgi:signal transduction histidine kinase